MIINITSRVPTTLDIMSSPKPPQTEQLFLSYSRNDPDAATLLRHQLTQHGLYVFQDDKSIREGELWLERLSEAVKNCVSFVVLVGRDGVQRWIGAETQVALLRHFDERDDTKRVAIYPILLGDTRPDVLPAFLRLFQATQWNGVDPLPERLLEQIRMRSIVPNSGASFEGCPFVGLISYRIDQTELFFGRQKETLDALACFDTRAGNRHVRWLEISGNSGCGKSSLMNAGLLPLVDQGWLWPRTGYAEWRRVGPMMPGEHPVRMLAEHLARSFSVEMSDVVKYLADGDRALADWLRGRKKVETAFLLAIDQFEEFFTFADAEECRRFDRLLAEALNDPDCPLFVISTVRADFLDRFESLPRLLAVRNRASRTWTLPPIGVAGLREIVAGPARLAGLDVSDVQEAMVAEARDEPGALPLVENALHWLWENKGPDNRLSAELFTDQGGLAGILRQSADDLLNGLDKEKSYALDLLFRLVKVDPEGRQHTRRRVPLAEAVAVSGTGERGLALVNRLAGERASDNAKAIGPLRLITVTGDAAKLNSSGQPDRWVNLIHETLIRSRGLDAKDQPQPYWPMLWNYIEANKARAARRERLQALAVDWQNRTGLGRFVGLAGWSGVFHFRGVAAPGSIELRYWRLSAAVSALSTFFVVAVFGLIGEGVYWATTHELPLDAVKMRWAYKLGAALPLPKLVEIPAGTFKMGSQTEEKEKPVHPVTIARPFYLAETETTFDQYDAFAKQSARNLPDDQGWGRGTQPVVNVDWNDARAYVNWLGAMTGKSCRLPSEAEWEYAARARTTTEYALPADANGSDDIKDKALANCEDCGSKWTGKQTAPVGQFPANGWKLHDMHGNVWEWVEDCFHKNYEGAPENGAARQGGTGACQSRVLRGGAWNDFVGDVRSAARVDQAPGYRYFSIGFRVLCSSPIE